MELKPTREQIETMVTELAQQPKLFAQVQALLGEVNNERAASLDEAETAVVRQLRALGKEALGAWTEQTAARVAAPAGARRGAKKNCGA